MLNSHGCATKPKTQRRWTQVLKLDMRGLLYIPKQGKKKPLEFTEEGIEYVILEILWKWQQQEEYTSEFC